MAKKKAAKAKVSTTSKPKSKVRATGEAVSNVDQCVESKASGPDGSNCNFQFDGVSLEHLSELVGDHSEADMASAYEAGENFVESEHESIPSDAAELEHLLTSQFEDLAEYPYEAEKLEKLIGSDDRIEVTEPEIYPYHSICYLLIETNLGRILAGTGWLIASRLVVTAGHCVYRRDEQDYVKRIRIYRGGCKQKEFVQESRKFYVCGSYPTCEYRQMTDYDYGAIVLDEPFINTGTLGVGVYDDADLVDNTYSLIGYPVDKPARTMWHHARPLTVPTPRTLEYQIDTFPGMSGGPVLDLVKGTEGTRYIAIAIHSGSIQNRPLNRACRIVDRVWENLDQWRTALELG